MLAWGNHKDNLNGVKMKATDFLSIATSSAPTGLSYIGNEDRINQ